MSKLRDQAKRFHSTHTNRVNYDNFLKEHQDLPTSNLIRDLNEPRIDSRHNLIRSSLRLKRALIMYFGAYQLPQFLSEVDWKFANEAEAVLALSKDVSKFAQCEGLLNATFGPVMRKILHKRLSANKVMMIDVPNWRKTPRAPRLLIDVSTWSAEGIECKRRALLECERRFFGNTTEIIMQNPVIRLAQREKAALVLDKRNCMNKLVLSKAEWMDATNALEAFYANFYTIVMAYDRRIGGASGYIEEEEKNENDNIPTAYNDEADLVDIFTNESESIDNNNEQLSETMLQERDQQKGKIEFQRVIREWVKWRVPWRDLFPSLSKDRNLDPFEDLMFVEMKLIMEVIEKYNEENESIFGYLPLMCKSSICQLGALNAQSFAERMISCGNLIITKKRTKLDDDTINKLVVLRMNRKFMEFARKTGKSTLAHIRGIANAD